MEVHHHPDLHHKRKKFKEYFLEFLMIFLAVTMGFFVENIREHFSDNERVAQLSRQLIQDLKKDTASLNENIRQQTVLQKQADSVVKMLQQSVEQFNYVLINVYKSVEDKAVVLMQYTRKEYGAEEE